MHKHTLHTTIQERERERERIPISPIEIIVLPPLRSSSLRLLILFVPSWLRFYSLLLVHVHIYMERITNGGNYPTYIYIYIYNHIASHGNSLFHVLSLSLPLSLLKCCHLCVNIQMKIKMESSNTKP